VQVASLQLISGPGLIPSVAQCLWTDSWEDACDRRKRLHTDTLHRPDSEHFTCSSENEPSRRSTNSKHYSEYPVRPKMEYPSDSPSQLLKWVSTAVAQMGPQISCCTSASFCSAKINCSGVIWQSQCTHRSLPPLDSPSLSLSLSLILLEQILFPEEKNFNKTRTRKKRSDLSSVRLLDLNFCCFVVTNLHNNKRYKFFFAEDPGVFWFLAL